MDTSNEFDSEFGSNVYKNMMDLFFTPEISKRINENKLPANFVLHAAQVIFFPDGRPNLIKLNEEVSIEVKLKKGIDPNERDFWPSSGDIENVKLTEPNLLNCGHVTLIALKDTFQISFDFQYNKKLCADHLRVAKEFIQTSQYALDTKLFSSFIDNSFSAMELLAKTNLLIEANKRVSNRVNHNSIKTAFNLRFKNSNSEFEVRRKNILNKLSDARAKARYLEGETNFKESELAGIYNTIEEMWLELSDRAGIPK